METRDELTRVFDDLRAAVQDSAARILRAIDDAEQRRKPLAAEVIEFPSAGACLALRRKLERARTQLEIA